mmetsp:Transcript_25248/g.30518  ORF Transcript_25248/g.30518 Transcript_25248/m.30518 type:complete len:139 (+) Transcript_25248:175-591(+)
MSAATTQPTPSSTTNRLLPTTADNATTRNDEQHQSSLFLAPNEQPNHSNGLIPVLNPVPSQSFDTATTGLGISSEHGISPSELICPVAPQSQQQQPVSILKKINAVGKITTTTAIATANFSSFGGDKRNCTAFVNFAL